MITTMELMLIKEAVSSTALENGWDKDKEQEMFDQAVNYLLGLKNEYRAKTT